MECEMNKSQFSNVMFWSCGGWIKGHLTVTEKRHVLAILNSGLDGGRINNTDYIIQEYDEEYIVEITRKDRGLGFIGSPLRLSTYRYKFTLR